MFKVFSLMEDAGIPSLQTFVQVFSLMEDTGIPSLQTFVLVSGV